MMLTWKHTEEAIPAGHYRYFKGYYYKVRSIDRHCEALEPRVLCQTLLGDGSLWVCHAEI